MKYIKTLRICMRLFLKKYKGTSFCTCQKASFTLEAAIVVPIMVGFLVCILFLFRVIQVQAAVEECLMYTGRKLAVESCVLDSQEAMFLAAEAQMLGALEENEIVAQYVRYGKYGVFLGRSDFEGEMITLCAEYDVKLPVSFFEIDSLHLSSVNQFRKWKKEKIQVETDQYVYITETGGVYHQGLGCRVLDLSISAISILEIERIRGLDGQKYYPCNSCKNSKKEEGIVYYTDYGTRYHEDISCSALKRSVKKILKSQIGNKRACSFCFP